ncbi:MAG: glycosyltransferase family 2 protein [Armatimonadetes bacterium]|nr:glycosyltransferase family 2 protein [Armatimonadota bacterium]
MSKRRSGQSWKAAGSSIEERAHFAPAGRPLKAAVVIPAHNETARLGNTLKSVLDAALVNEVIVVSDGSTDGTANLARTYDGVRVVELPFNIGKGGAMCAGVAHTNADIIAFFDADLVGLRSNHVDQIIRPLLNRQCDMCVGVFRGGKFWSDTGQVITPFLSGQRAMYRRLFEAVPFLPEIRMGAEITITTYAKRLKATVKKVVLRGVSHTHKERKLGLVKGATARAKMYREIAQAMVKVSKKRRRSGWSLK